MEASRVLWRLMCSSFHLYLCLSAIVAPRFFLQCDAYRRDLSMASPPNSRNSDAKLNALMNMILDMVRPLDDSPQSNANSEPYGVSSPFTLPPYDSLAPIPLPQNAPPFCIYPPFTPLPPPPPPPVSFSPSFPLPPPPPVSFSPSFPFPNPNPSPPQYVPTPMPPTIVLPSPTQYIPTPPMSGGFTPPSPSGGGGGGGGGGFVPSPPVFLPPIVYPPPAVPPPPYTAPAQTLWCVAKPSVPGPIIQEALNYACASGAECNEIQPGGSCFEPNTLVAHASYAFNSYWQKTRVAGGTCGFGGIAILVTVDPSYDGCHFMYS